MRSAAHAAKSCRVPIDPVATIEIFLIFSKETGAIENWRRNSSNREIITAENQQQDKKIEEKKKKKKKNTGENGRNRVPAELVALTHRE